MQLFVAEPILRYSLQAHGTGTRGPFVPAGGVRASRRLGSPVTMVRMGCVEEDERRERERAEGDNEAKEGSPAACDGQPSKHRRHVAATRSAGLDAGWKSE